MQLDMGTKVTTAEVTNSLNSILKDTTPGPDKVAYSDLKSISGDKELLNDLTPLDLTQHINSTTLKKGSIPLDWRDCNLSVLPKPKKDHRIFKGYRVITVANTLVKLCEKTAPKRVTAQLEKEGRLPKEVGGARAKRSTTSNIEALIYIIQKGLQDKEHFALGLYDLEDAYNRVHIPL